LPNEQPQVAPADATVAVEIDRLGLGIPAPGRAPAAEASRQHPEVGAADSTVAVEVAVAAIAKAIQITVELVVAHPGAVVEGIADLVSIPVPAVTPGCGRKKKLYNDC
jgi:hypothetical protein